MRRPSSFISQSPRNTCAKVVVLLLIAIVKAKVATAANGQASGGPGCEIGCFPLDQSIQAGCSLSFLCRYDLPLPPNVYLNGSLLLNFRPSTDNSSVTSPPCTNEHCVIPSTGKITGNMVLIKLSQPLLGCQNGLHLKIEYKIPFGPGCRIAKYEQVSTLGCDSCKAVTESPSTGRDVATTDGGGSSEHTSLLVGCITLAIIVIAVAAIAIAAISVAAYFAKERIKRASCKVYCQSNEQPSSSQNDSGVEETDGFEDSPTADEDEMPLYTYEVQMCSPV